MLKIEEPHHPAHGDRAGNDEKAGRDRPSAFCSSRRRGVLQAVVTDGDIRKFFLRGGTLEAPVEQAANFTPSALPVSERGRAKAELQRHGIDALPILNKRGVITDIVFAGGVDVDNRKRVDIPVVMMAGGLGTRLYPYTKILPKPLIPVGEQPIAELIIDRFRGFGCHRFTMVVNYKKGMIKSYFGDLEKDYTLDFVDETQFMGTGGGLCLLKGKVDSPFFFTNCDTLLDLDFGDLYEKHHERGNLITMGVRAQALYGALRRGGARRGRRHRRHARKAGAELFDQHRRLCRGAARGRGNARRRDHRLPRRHRPLPRRRGKRSAFTPSTKAPG